MGKNKSITNKRLGLIGKDIGYSFSRGYFADKFEKEKIDSFSYENFDIKDIREVSEVLSEKSIVGLNVTIPYKETIIPFLDHVVDDAALIGAVNTICFNKKGESVGYNTDTYGFETALRNMLPVFPKKAFILGTGGAAKAVHYVLTKNNVAVTFVSRSQKEGSIAYETLSKELIEKHPLIVNCSPVGTFPAVEEAPDIPYEYLSSAHSLFDLIYNPVKTKFLSKGEECGTRIQNGLAMLEYQAEKSWEYWMQNQ